MTTKTPTNHQQTLVDVLEFMDAEDWQSAIDLLLRTDSVRSDFKLAWNLGWAYFKKRELGNAVAWLKRACELRPNGASGHWALGCALADAGNQAEAEHQLLLSLALRDAYVARSALGVLYHRQGRLEEAEAVYVEGIRLRADDGRRLGALADFLADCGRQTEANEYYAKAAVAPKPDTGPA